MPVTGGENRRKKETRQPSNVVKDGAASRIKKRLLINMSAPGEIKKNSKKLKIEAWKWWHTL